MAELLASPDSAAVSIRPGRAAPARVVSLRTEPSTAGEELNERDEASALETAETEKRTQTRQEAMRLDWIHTSPSKRQARSIDAASCLSFPSASARAQPRSL